MPAASLWHLAYRGRQIDDVVAALVDVARDARDVFGIAKLRLSCGRERRRARRSIVVPAPEDANLRAHDAVALGASRYRRVLAMQPSVTEVHAELSDGVGRARPEIH